VNQASRGLAAGCGRLFPDCSNPSTSSRTPTTTKAYHRMQQPNPTHRVRRPLVPRDTSPFFRGGRNSRSFASRPPLGRRAPPPPGAHNSAAGRSGGANENLCLPGGAGNSGLAEKSPEAWCSPAEGYSSPQPGWVARSQRGENRTGPGACCFGGGRVAAPGATGWSHRTACPPSLVLSEGEGGAAKQPSWGPTCGCPAAPGEWVGWPGPGLRFWGRAKKNKKTKKNPLPWAWDVCPVR